MDSDDLYDSFGVRQTYHCQSHFSVCSIDNICFGKLSQSILRNPGPIEMGPLCLIIGC